MPQARDEAGNIWEVDARGNPIRLVSAAGAPQMPADPTFPYQGPKSAADLQGAILKNQGQALNNEVTRQTAPAVIQEKTADAALKTASAGKIATEQEQAAKKASEKAFLDSMTTDNVMSAIAAARRLVTEGRGTGWGSLLSKIPETQARTLAAYLDTIRSNLTFDRLQQMRDNSPTGGAVGNASDNDMRLLGSTVASLDQGVDAKTLLSNLDKIANHYKRFQAYRAGIDPDTTAGQQAMQALGSPASGGPGEPLTPEQQSMIDAFYKANPHFTADQFASFAKSVGIPPITNIAEIVAARDAGQGVAPAAKASFADMPDQGSVAQGITGINSGIASLLGLPVDAFTSALNLTGKGTNAVEQLFGGRPLYIPIENPVGGSQWMQDRFGDAGFIGPEPKSPRAQFWNRVGQSVGAALVPGLGGARTLGSVAAALASGIGGGFGAAAAQQAFPDSKTAEIGGELLGSFATAVPSVAAAGRSARNAVRANVPTVDELKRQASDLYAAAEARGVVATPDVTTDLADRITQIAKREALVSPKGYVSEAYPKLRPVLKSMQDEAGETMTPKRIQVLRETLADAAHTTEGKEQKIARDMLRTFDDVTVPLAPELSDARDVASRYLQARPIDTAIELAGTRTGQFSQSGQDNALRTDFANLERRAINGDENFNPQTLAAIHAVANPSGLRAAARWGGRFAPTSTIPIGVTGSPAAVGYMAGEPVAGALVSGGLGAGGLVSKALANKLAAQQAEDASLMARSGGTMILPGAGDNATADAVASALAGQSALYYDTPEQRDNAVAKILAQAQFAPQ